MKTNMEQSATKEHARAMYNLGCIEYLRLFCEKHGFDYDDAKDAWVGMDTIIADIEMNATEHDFVEWYNYCLDANEFGLVVPNFKSWVLGCPRTSEETLGHLRKLKQDLNDCIKKEKENNLF